jgi:hypothetical protein
MSEGKERRYSLLSGRGVGYERMCAVGYKWHGNEMIAVWNGEGRRYLLLLKGSRT